MSSLPSLVIPSATAPGSVPLTLPASSAVSTADVTTEYEGQSGADFQGKVVKYTCYPVPVHRSLGLYQGSDRAVFLVSVRPIKYVLEAAKAAYRVSDGEQVSVSTPFTPCLPPDLSTYRLRLCVSSRLVSSDASSHHSDTPGNLS